MTDPMDTSVDRLHDQTRSTREHLARADTKASLLLGLSGAAAAAGSGLIAAHHLYVVAAGFAWASVACFAAATALLIVAVRPVLTGPDWGLVRHGAMTAEDLAAGLDDPAAAAAELLGTTTLALAKYRRIRWATDLMLAALALAAVAAIVAALL